MGGERRVLPRGLRGSVVTLKNDVANNPPDRYSYPPHSHSHPPPLYHLFVPGTTRLLAWDLMELCRMNKK